MEYKPPAQSVDVGT